MDPTKSAAVLPRLVRLDGVHAGGPCRVELFSRHVERFRGRLASKAHRLLYHSTEGLGLMKKKVGVS